MGRQGSTGRSENTEGRGTQSGDSWEDILKEGRSQLNSKAGQNELVKEGGKVL